MEDKALAVLESMAGLCGECGHKLTLHNTAAEGYRTTLLGHATQSFECGNAEALRLTGRQRRGYSWACLIDVCNCQRLRRDDE